MTDGQQVGIVALAGVWMLIAIGYFMGDPYQERREAIVAEFMEECLQYKKKYECDFMWRSSRRSWK